MAAGMYYEPMLDMTAVIHGDDVLTEGEWESLDVLDQQLTGEMDIKSLGRDGPVGLEAIKYLKHTIKWTGKGFSWTGDSKHIAKAVEALGLQDAKPADTPGTKATGKTIRDALEPLPGACGEVVSFGGRAGELRGGGPPGHPVRVEGCHRVHGVRLHPHKGRDV